MSEAITCEACDRGYRLNPDGLHYNDDAGGATWGICRKVTTTNHPTPELLSESALAEIEARHKLASSGFQSYVEVDNSLADIPALCATLRAAWAERDEVIKARDLFVSLKRGQTERADELYARGLELLSENTTLRDQLAELQRHNDTQAESIMEFQAGEKSLRAQLAQVEKERDELQGRIAEEVAKRVNQNVEKAESRPIPPRTWPKPWWG